MSFTPRISIMAAISKNHVLGNNNEIIWDLPTDRAMVERVTTGHFIIMGRKTFEQIGNTPLDNRVNIVITRDAEFDAEGIIVAHSIEEALEIAKTMEQEEVFVMGGGQIFTVAMPFVERLYLTVIDKEYQGDAFFPDYSEFNKVVSQEKHHENDIDFTFFVLERE